MNSILSSFAKGVRLEGLRYYVDPDGSELVVPVPAGDGKILIHVSVDETEPVDAILHAELCTVPPAKRTAVALRLAEINTGLRFITFSMHNGTVVVDTCQDLCDVTDKTAALHRALVRLMIAIARYRAGLAGLLHGKGQSHTRFEREIEQIIKESSRP